MTTNTRRPYHPGENVHDATEPGSSLSLDYDEMAPGKINVGMSQGDLHVGTVELLPVDARAFANALNHWAADIVAEEILNEVIDS